MDDFLAMDESSSQVGYTPGHKKTEFKKESMMLPVASGSQVHLRRIYCSSSGTPIFMVPGIAEDGHIFYSNKGEGLAYLLADVGYDVYVTDLRGRGRSWPHINKFSEFGQHETITEDIPACIRAIKKKRGDVPQIWISHSWGGVLLLSYLARYGYAETQVKGLVHFGPRRQLLADNLQRKLLIDFLWRKLAAKLVALRGYFPAKSLSFGSSDESARSYRDYSQWMFEAPWVDSTDQFDYGAAIKALSLPRSIYFASKTDAVFGNLNDIRHFLMELGSHDGRLIVLGRECGNSQDYGHVDMLLHPNATTDHFQTLLDWLVEVDYAPESQSSLSALKVNS